MTGTQHSSRGASADVVAEDVTVVVATRGGRPEMLAEAIGSVLDQTYPGRVEIVMVLDDDGPLPDAPRDLPGNRGVRVIRNDGVRGLAGARNAGLTQVASEWLATIDDDDTWAPTKLAEQLRLASSDPTAVAIGSGITVVDGHGMRADRPARADRITHADLVRDRIAELHPSTFLTRTARILEIGGWDEAIPGGYGEDYDLLLRLTRIGDVLMVPDSLTTVRWSGQSYFFSRWITIEQGLRYLLDKHPDITRDARGHARVLGQVAFAQAAAGDRQGAARTAVHTLRRNPLERRAVLALAASSGLVTADRIQAALHKRGRGI
jgi:glycosyltransferase involved in cell wall biosynthesis